MSDDDAPVYEAGRTQVDWERIRRLRGIGAIERDDYPVVADRAAGLPADATTAASAAIHAAKGRHWDGVIDPDALARVALAAAGPVIAAEAARQERQRICDKLSRYGLDNPDWAGVLEVAIDLIEEGT